MDWFIKLLTEHSVAGTLLTLSLVAAAGLALGRLSIRGISLGIAGVLFSGIAMGHLHRGIDHETLHFVREFGLILFVYAIGMQVGPGFFASLRRQGLRLNLMALFIVVSGAGVALALHYGVGIPGPAAVGLFSGATTNTPSLAAAQEVLQDLPAVSEEARKLPALGYAMAYPFGVLGIILTMLALRSFFRVKLDQEAEAFALAHQAGPRGVQTMNVEITLARLDGIPLCNLPGLTNSGIVISRILQKRLPELARPDTRVEVGDILLVIGPREELTRFCEGVGREVTTDIRFLPSAIATKRMVVTKREVLGRTLAELNLRRRLGVTVTRLRRADIDFTPGADLALQFGDSLMVVGSEEDLKRVALELGDSPQALDHPRLIPLFVGVALGVLVGSLPLSFPGLPAPVKLGLAGGPLLVAIVFSRLRQVGPLVWFLPLSANFLLREMGIVLFLACVGLGAGDRFVNTLMDGGLCWMVCASTITLLPIVVAGLFARFALRWNFLTICGVLAGSMTDPPALAFASTATGSDAPSIAYAAVYPLTMILRVLAAQFMVLLMS
jgi:putative transport protein